MTTAAIGDLERVRTLAPGPDLAALLAGLDETQLDDGQQLDVIAAWSRLRAWTEARELRLTAIVAGPPGEERAIAAAALGTRLHLPHVTASERLDLAWTLVSERRRTLRALHAGRLNVTQAAVIVDEVRNLSPLDARWIEVDALGLTDRTAASMRKTLRRKALTVDPEARSRRHKEAVKGRVTWLRDLGDGMAEFGARLPAADALRCAAAVDTKARELRADGDERTADQRRADALVHLVTGGQAAVVDIILRGIDDQAVATPGFGPLDSDTLRELLTNATIFLRPLGLAPTGVSTYRPSAGLDRWIRASDPTCRFPGCSVRSADCDLDHVIPWHQGGTTSARNLMPLCRKHHRLKTFHPWKPALNPDRSVTWTDPTGRQHHVPPPDS